MYLLCHNGITADKTSCQSLAIASCNFPLPGGQSDLSAVFLLLFCQNRYKNAILSTDTGSMSKDIGVLSKDIESAMIDELVKHARERGFGTLFMDTIILPQKHHYAIFTES
jgi:hypothetical protein